MSHSNPLTGADEVATEFEKVCNEEKRKKMLKTEITLRKLISLANVANKPHLYKLNKLTVDELKTNLIRMLMTKLLAIGRTPWIIFSTP